MGTRALTRIAGILNFYTHYDGDPGSYGRELADFLHGFIVSDGGNTPLSRQTPAFKIANGPECLAPQIVAHFKKGPGEYYLLPLEQMDVDQEYVYVIKFPSVKVLNRNGDTIFNGSTAEFVDFCKDDDA